MKIKQRAGMTERGEDLEGLYTIDEMDEDEEYEWTEEHEKLAEKQEEEYYEEKDELDDHPEPHENSRYGSA